jgi:predicted acylesterase/phospholipase RssA
VADSIHAYLHLSKEVFNIDEVIFENVPVGEDDCRFDHRILETVIKRLIKQHLGSEDFTMSAASNTSHHCCPTFVVAKSAHDVNASRPTIFRSYAGENARSSQCRIWQAARATSAAPSFFKDVFIEIPPPGCNYIDGGLGYNNPSELALNEATELWPSSTNFCLVSIGTGRQARVQLTRQPEMENDTIEHRRSRFQELLTYLPALEERVPNWKTVKSFPKGAIALMKIAKGINSVVTSSEEVHQRLSTNSKAIGNPFPYFRFNVERDVGDIGLGDWKRLTDIQSHTSTYLQEFDTNERKMDCVKYLISPPTFNCK